MSAPEARDPLSDGAMPFPIRHVPLLAYLLVASVLVAYLLCAAHESEFFFFLGALGIIVTVTAVVNFELAFLFVPLTLTNPYTLSETGTRLHLSEFVLLILFGVWLVRMLLGGRKYDVPAAFFILGGVIVVVATLSLLGARYMLAGAQQIVRYIEILFALLFVIVNSPRETRRIEQIFGLLIVGGLLASIVGLVQFVTGASTMGETRRIFGWHGGGYGALISSTLVLCASAIAYDRNRWIRAWALVAVPFAGLALVLSQTRAWIGAFLIVLLFMFVRVRREVMLKIALVLGIIIVTVGIIIETNAFGLVQENLVQSAVDTAFRFGQSPGKRSLEDISLLLRLNVWRHGIAYAIAHPLLGIGAGNLRFEDYVTAKLGDPSGEHVGYVDNQYIQFFAECGVIGGLAWIFYMLKAVRVGARSVRSSVGTTLHAAALGFYSSFLIFAVGSFFWVVTPQHELFALMILSIGMLLNIQRVVDTPLHADADQME